MEKKAILKWILLVLLGTWLTVSIFFYFQHQVKSETCYIGEYIEFDDFSILVKNVEKCNYEKNSPRLSYTILNLKLPLNIKKALLNINYFYSQPYHVEKDLYQYTVNCEIIYQPELTDDKYLSLDITDKIDIGIYNETSEPLNTPIRFHMQSASNMNILQYSYISDWIDASRNGIKIIDNTTDKEYLFPFDNSFSTHTYGYFNQEIEDRRQIINETVTGFLFNYYNGNPEKYETYINQDFIENFPWHILTQHEKFKNINFKLSYLGNYMDKNNVFIMHILEGKKSDFIKKFDLYMIYEDSIWQIIDIA